MFDKQPLFFFEADKGGHGNPSGGTDPVEKPAEPIQQEEPKIEFTPEQQAAIDAIVKERVAREKRKAEEEKHRIEQEAKLKEQGEFQKLLEAKENELKQLQESVKQAEIKQLKTSLLADAGYSKEQLEFAMKNLEGETEDELKLSLESLKAIFAPKQEEIGFPSSTGNGVKHEPKPKGDEELGREMARRIKERRNR